MRNKGGNDNNGMKGESFLNCYFAVSKERKHDEQMSDEKHEGLFYVLFCIRAAWQQTSQSGIRSGLSYTNKEYF